MDKSVSRELPEFSALPDERAVKSEMSQNAGATQEARHDCGKYVHGDEQRRDMNRMTSHPCHRLVVIGGGDPEHASIMCARFSRASTVRFGPNHSTAKIRLEKRPKR